MFYYFGNFSISGKIFIVRLIILVRFVLFKNKFKVDVRIGFDDLYLFFLWWFVFVCGIV